jgi:hypothetical protein
MAAFYRHPRRADLAKDAILPFRQKFGIEDSAPPAVKSEPVFIKAKRSALVCGQT